MAGGGGEQNADDFVLDETQPFGAAPPVTIPEQNRLRRRTRLDEFGLQQLCNRGAENVLMSGMFRRQRVDRGGDPRRVETFVSLRVGLCHDAVHEVSGYRTARALSRIIVGWQLDRAAFQAF